jgi:hypothetical protein
VNRKLTQGHEKKENSSLISRGVFSFLLLCLHQEKKINNNNKLEEEELYKTLLHILMPVWIDQLLGLQGPPDIFIFIIYLNEKEIKTRRERGK